MKEIMLSGVFGYELSPEFVRSELNSAKGGDVEVVLASPGGDVFDGIDIYNQFSDYKRKNPESQMILKMSGVVASMGAYLAMNPSFDLITAEDNAAFMVHNAWSLSIGDHNQLRKDADMLEGLSSPMRNLVATKMGIEKEEAAKILDNETWFFGSQIVEAGFAHEIVERPVGSKDRNKDSANAELKSIQAEISRRAINQKALKAVAQIPIATVGSYDDNVKIIEQTWDSAQADRRWREHAGATESPNAKYRQAFLYYDSENSDNFTAYKLQVKDFVDGQEVVNIRAVNNADARLNQVDGPSAADKERIQSILNRYQARWKREQDNNSNGALSTMNENELKAEGAKAEKERVKSLMEIKAKYKSTPSAELISGIVDKAIEDGSEKADVLTEIQVAVASGNVQAALESPGATPQGQAGTISGEPAAKKTYDFSDWS